MPLPAELIVDIARRLPKISDLNALSRTCRQTHMIVDDMLYRSATNPNTSMEIHYTYRSRVPWMLRDYCLVKALSRTNTLGAFFRMLDLCPGIEMNAISCNLCDKNEFASIPGMLPRNGRCTLHTEDLFLTVLRKDRTEAATLFLNRYADIARRSCCVAWWCRSGAMLRLMVEHGASVEQQGPRKSGEKVPLHAAVITMNFDKIETLIDLGASPEKRDRRGFTPLVTAVDCYTQYAREKMIIAIRILIASDANINSSGALHLAAAYVNEVLLEIFVKAGADLTSRYIGPSIRFGRGASLQEGMTVQDSFDAFYFERRRLAEKRKGRLSKMNVREKEDSVRKFFLESIVIL